MSHDRQHPVVPPRPSYLDDEDEAMKKAIALSLVSAKEDDQRRHELYGLDSGGFYTGSADTTSQKSTSLISRPRPQASGSGRDSGGFQIAGPPKTARPPPVVPPRPDVESATLPPRPQKIPQGLLNINVMAPSGDERAAGADKSSFAELDGSAPRVPAAIASLATMPRPQKRSTNESADPIGNFLSRQMLSQQQQRSQSVPPIRQQPESRTPDRSPNIVRRRPTPSPTPQQAAVSDNVFNDIFASSLSSTSTTTTKHLTADEPLIKFAPNTDPLDFDLDSLDPLKGSYDPKFASNPSTRFNTPSHDSLASKLRRSEDLLGTGDSLKKKSASACSLNAMDKSNPTYGTHIPTNFTSQMPVVPARPSVTTPAILPNPFTMDRNSLPPPASSHQQISPVPQRKAIMGFPSATNTTTAATHQAITKASNSLVGDMKMTNNQAYVPVEPSIFLMRSKAGSPKLDTTEDGYLKPTVRTSDASSRSSATSDAYTIPDGAMVLQRPSTGDLMDFSESRHEYLSLEAFDPLYSVEDERLESNDSLSLFPNPLDRLQRKNTPNPFPSINTITTQSLMRKSSLCDLSSTGSPERSSLQSKKSSLSSAAVAPDPMIESLHELQDPFSVPDLLKALERKRQEHAKEQVQRQAELKAVQAAEEAEVQAARLAIEAAEGEDRAKVITRDKARPKYDRRSSYIQHGEESSYEILHDFPETADEEIQAFCGMVASLKMQYRNTDEATNPGVIISPRCKHPKFKAMTVKLMVCADFIEDPGYPFTCDVNATVSHAISAVLLSASDSMDTVSAEEFVFKVQGLSEYLLNDSVLADYAYVQECLKLDVDIRFLLVQKSKMDIPFKRTPEDDRNALFVPKPRDVAEKGMKITKDKLNILMETFYKEVEKLRDNAIQHGLERVQSRSVIQSVKAICAVLYKMETISILRAMDRLQSVNLEKSLHTTCYHDQEAFAYVTKDGEAVLPVRDSENVRKVSDLDDLHIALEEMTMAVKSTIELYCRTFHTDYRFRSTTQVVRAQKESNEVQENLIVHIASVHRISDKVKSIYREFKIICGLYYGGQKITQEVMTSARPSWAPIFGDTLIWDEWLLFDSVMVCNLPREARLCLTLIGVKVVQSSGSDQTTRINTPIGWVGLQLFNHEFKLTQGSQLLGLWPGDLANPTGTSISNTEMAHSLLLQVNLPQFECDYVFPAIQTVLPSVKQDIESLHPNDQELVSCILEKDSITRLSRSDSEFLWEKRHFLYQCPSALPRVLQQVGNWYWGSLTETYSMVSEWEPLSSEQALELLLPHYPDTYVREKGAEWLGSAMIEELCNYLPQLVQALKYESHHTSALARLVIEKAICSVRFAHMLYWLLKEAADDFRYRKRYQLMFGALLSVVGEGMRQELAKEEDTVKMFSAIAEKVKAAKDKEGVLSRELYNMWDFLQYDSVRLPLNPATEFCGVDVKSCSYFTSFTFPLKLVLKNVDPKADGHYAMFKVGDDLRQDMLTMQLIDVMDKVWLQEGLDLKMVTFTCVHTGVKKGLVQIITESETLRKIQTKHGVGGSFKDRPIAEWLQLQNPTELEYQKACDNFTASCAGYCVATYILGIGDRHNDNIMIKQSGHLFHIDFAKFLGDAQMLGTIKRDRVPFVLTSDMAYVINGGDKRPTGKFQHFVDLCCQAFNILRHHSNLFINLLSMMSLSGIPGVSANAAKYVQKALLPDTSDPEATAVFTRMIHDSLKSTFTQFNFFIHNLAQMKFHGHSDGALLSFIPKTYSLSQDGRIKHVDIHGIQKRYSPEKFYIYIIRVVRESQTVPSLVFRRYSEFQELHQKLVMNYPLIRLPSLANRVILGRTHVRHVAEERRAELELFLQSLLDLAPEISESDLIYTFFHPMLRDEQDAGKINLQKLKESSPHRSVSRTIQGQVKLSLTYKNKLLTVMVMHVKDLAPVSTGESPDPYVKLYLLPDPGKLTKRKTKIQKHTFNPTYNEMLYYHLSLEDVKQRTLQVSVWDFDKLKENEFLGATFIMLGDLELTKETPAWYPLQAMHTVSTGR